MKLRQLIEKIAKEKGAAGFCPDAIEKTALDMMPEILLKSDTLQMAYGIPDEDMEALYAEGYSFYEEGNYVQSADVFRWLVLFNPFAFRFWMGLGASQQLLQLHEKALHSYAVAALLDASTPYPHLYAFDCYSQLGDQEEAVKALALAEVRALENAKYQSVKDEISLIKNEMKSCRLP